MSDELDELRNKVAALQQQAEAWKMEAAAHKASLHEVYQLLTDATGEPANWNGARPVKQFLEADRESFIHHLRAWYHRKTGKWITHSTGRDAFYAFDIYRRDLARKLMAATSILRRPR